MRVSMFSARRAGNEYVFEGKGSGHGVGLSQWGTHELASRGSSYQDILDFYYTDVHLESLDGESEPRGDERHVATERKEESRTPTRRIGW